ncbi:3278_t:CDS:2, partial [Funneliformis geosporum]
ARAFSNNVFTIDIQSNSLEERLIEEQDSNEYANWQNTLPCTQSTTLVSSAFANIIEELKLFTSPQIQKIHYNEMEMAFSYDAKLLDQTYINN